MQLFLFAWTFRQKRSTMKILLVLLSATVTFSATIPSTNNQSTISPSTSSPLNDLQTEPRVTKSILEITPTKGRTLLNITNNLPLDLSSTSTPAGRRSLLKTASRVENSTPKTSWSKNLMFRRRPYRRKRQCSVHCSTPKTTFEIPEISGQSTPVTSESMTSSVPLPSAIAESVVDVATDLPESLVEITTNDGVSTTRVTTLHSAIPTESRLTTHSSSIGTTIRPVTNNVPITRRSTTKAPSSSSEIPTSRSLTAKSLLQSTPRLRMNNKKPLFSSKRRGRIRDFRTSKTSPTTTKPKRSANLEDLQEAASHLSEVALNHMDIPEDEGNPHLSKPLAMFKRPSGKSDFMGLGVMPPRGSPAAKGPFKPSIIYKGLIRKSRPGMQFKRTPNGPPPTPPPMSLEAPKRSSKSISGEVSIPSEHPSQFSMADPKKGTYRFGYDTGTIGEQSYRFEKRHPDGKVTGKYGYIDPEGVLREVNYVADEQGYRPTLVNRYRVDTNFPFIGPIPSKIKFN